MLREGLGEIAGLIVPRRALLWRALACVARDLDATAAIRTLERDPDPVWLELLGVACARFGHDAQAARLLRRAVELAPERVSALRALASCGATDVPEGVFPAMYLHHHLGLGDHILCNALVRHFARLHGTLGLFVKKPYLTSVRFMYRDVPGISLRAVRDDHEVLDFLKRWPGARCIRIGFDRLDTRTESFAENFYRQAGMNYARRWEGRIDRDPAREESLYSALVGGLEQYVFVHDDPARGYVIDRNRLPADVPVIRPRLGLTDNIFDYGLVLARAKEIHCMDSSFRHVVDTFGLTGPRLFLHLYAKGVDVPSCLEWSVLR